MVASSGAQLQAQVFQLQEQAAQIALAASSDVHFALPSAGGSNQPAGMQPERQEIQAQLQQVEASLAHLPEGAEWTAVRQPLLDRHAALRARLVSARPLGARIDGCRAALERSRSRQQAASDAVDAATAARQTAHSQTTSLEAELHELEEQVAAYSRATEGGNCITRLQGDMARIISEMGSSQVVTQQEVQEVLAQMASLFQSVTAISHRVTVPPVQIPPDDDVTMPLSQEPGQRKITQLFAAQRAPATAAPATSRAAAMGGS